MTKLPVTDIIDDKDIGGLWPAVYWLFDNMAGLCLDLSILPVAG